MCHKYTSTLPYTCTINHSICINYYVYKRCSSICGSVLQVSITYTGPVRWDMYLKTYYSSSTTILSFYCDKLHSLYISGTHSTSTTFYMSTKHWSVYYMLFLCITVGYYAVVTVPADSINSAIMQFLYSYSMII